MRVKELVTAIDGAPQQTRTALADQLRTPSECATALNVSSSTFLWWTNNYANFPAPFKGDTGKRGLRPLYWWNDIETWYAAREAKKG